MNTFSKESKSDKLDLERMIEVKKRQLKPVESADDTINMRLPNELFNIYNEHNSASQFEMSVRGSKFKGSVKKNRDRLIITKDIFIDMFDKSKQEIIRHLKGLLSRAPLSNIRTLLLVGGFSESKIIQEAVKEAFPGFEVITPTNGGLAIVMGKV